MSRNALTRAMRAALACTAFTLVLAGAARADEAARIRFFDFTTQNVNNQVINVVSTDNNRWNKIEPGNVSFGAHVNVQTRASGMVRTVGIILGQCGGADCGGKPLLWSRAPYTRDYENQMVVTFPTSQIPVSDQDGIASVHPGDEIVRRCNAHLTHGGLQQHSFDYLMPATFAADTFITWSAPNYSGSGDGEAKQWIGDADHALTRTFLVSVVCKPFQREQVVGDTTAEQPQVLKVGAIDLETIPTSAISKPNPTTECKKGKLHVTLTTNKAGPVKFKLWTKIGDGPTTSDFIEAWAAHAGPGQYEAEYTRWVEVTKTSTVQAMAEDMTNPIGQSTGWKELTLACKSGGFADVPNTHNPDTPSYPPTVQRNPKLDPVGGFGTGKPRPTHDTRVPGIKVAPVAPEPKLVCIGGKAAGVTCACPPRTTRIQFGPNSYRCEVNMVTPRPGFDGPRRDLGPQGLVGPRPGFERPGFARPGAARPFGRPMHESAIGPRRFFR